MRHQNRGGGGEFDGEIAVADRVQRVGGRRGEIQQLRGVVAIERITGAGQRRRAQRHDVDPLAAIHQALVIALEHFEPGQQVMAEGHRLGHLQMGEAGHDRVGLARRQFRQPAQQPLDFVQNGVDVVAQVQADVGGHLIVARAAGVQSLAGVADPLGQPRLDVHVDIFQRHRPVEFAALDLGANLLQPGARWPRNRPGTIPRPAPASGRGRWSR